MLPKTEPLGRRSGLIDVAQVEQSLDAEFLSERQPEAALPQGFRDLHGVAPEGSGSGVVTRTGGQFAETDKHGRLDSHGEPVGGLAVQQIHDIPIEDERRAYIVATCALSSGSLSIATKPPCAPKARTSWHYSARVWL